MIPKPTEQGAEAGGFADRLAAALPAIRTHVNALVGARGPIEPDDIVQETLSRALTHRSSFDGERPVLPWLKTVALRVLLDLRERERSQPGLGADEPLDRSVGDGLALRDQVQSLLARLPRREATVLDRFHRGGESLREIAEDMGLPLGTVKSLLHRARKHLAEGGS